ncbi:class D sortase [Hathewaya massiliensis]|uniref:class D sortase n=1 Tax=Hathewaya massiliensis TaxID=1964382 RepID=UPI0011592B32|nr:class D sortase [Hathewaya massiliensis]
MKYKKLLSIILIIFGLLIIAYPKLDETYNDYKQKEILKNIEIIEKDSYDEKDYEEVLNKKAQNTTPILKIDKINLKQPILDGATKENMAISVTSVNPKVKPGDKGNYSISGHRSYKHGRNFNRLNEIEKDDIIEVIYSGDEFKYKVNKKFLVKPHEVLVLDSKKNKPEITLITCEPMYNPTHRLIVQGELIK